MLNPCKICGSKRYYVIAYGHAFTTNTTFRVSCPECSYCTNEKDTRQEAIDIWNTPLPNIIKRKKRTKPKDN